MARATYVDVAAIYDATLSAMMMVGHTPMLPPPRASG